MYNNRMGQDRSSNLMGGNMMKGNRIVSKGNDLLMNHETKNATHGSPAIVELDSPLEKLLFLVEVIPAEIDVAVAEVTDMLVAGSRDVPHDGALQPTNEADDPH